MGMVGVVNIIIGIGAFLFGALFSYVLIKDNDK